MFTFQVSFWVALIAAGGGYVASIYTWPMVRDVLNRIRGA